MRRRSFITLLASAAAWSMVARAQRAGKTYTIGFLNPASVTLSHAVFFDALRALGWIEGKNVVVERRQGDNRPEKLHEAAVELVNLNVDVIVALGTLGPLAAKRATTTIPIVMANAGDPLGSGLIASLARPGGNVTGMSLMAPDLGGKRLELLKEALPRFARVAVLWNSANPYPAIVFNETKAAGQALGVQVHSLEVRSPGEFSGAFAATQSLRPDALIVVEDPLTVSHRKLIVEFAADHGVPALYGLKEFAVDGGLVTYGASLADLYRRAAGYVDKIFKGAKPADLPVQQPTKFEFIINLRTAKALGLELPPTLLARADEVIE